AARETLYQRNQPERLAEWSPEPSANGSVEALAHADAEPLFEPPTDSTMDTVTHTGTDDASTVPLFNGALAPSTEEEDEDEPLIAALKNPALEPPTYAQQQADALALLAETALRHELDPGAPGERYQVVVHVDAAVLADPEQPGQSALE